MVMGRTDGSAGEDLPPGSSGLWEVDGDSAALPHADRHTSSSCAGTSPEQQSASGCCSEGDADASQPVCVPGF